jgi:ectoine hydroxylase-related dioxygenase (phytanoyl-CoA dioxygenase family)
MAEEYARGGGRFFGDLDIAQRHPAFAEFVHQSPAAEIAGTVMSASKANFFYDQLLVKEPGTAAPTPWHQDQPYWGVSGRQVASIWLPLDDVKLESSLKYVAGSHLWEAHNPHNFIDDTPYEGTGLPELPDINANPEKYEILGWDMQPGDCLVFQAMIVHGSAGNSSLQNRRRALATRWTGDDARYAVRPGRVAIPTRDPGLVHGDIMDCEDFPVIWRAVQGTWCLAGTG